MPSGLGWSFKKRPFEGKNQLVNWQIKAILKNFKKLKGSHIWRWLGVITRKHLIWHHTAGLWSRLGDVLIAENVKKFLIDSMQTWKVELEEEFSRVIFLCLLPLTLVYWKNEDQIDSSRVQTVQFNDSCWVRTLNGRSLGWKSVVCWVNEKGKESKVWGITLLDGWIMGETGKERYKYLRIIKADVINEKDLEMKKKMQEREKN